MANLQDRLQASEDPPESGGDIDFTVPAGRLNLTGGVPFLQTEAEGIYIRPEAFVLAFATPLLDAPTTPSVVGTFNFLKAPPKLGRIFAEVIGPGGDICHPTLEGLVAEESAPGGFQSITGRVSERFFKAHPDSLRQDAKVILYLESDGTCVGAGRLNEPAVAGGAVQLTARGHAQRAEKLGEDILYSTEDQSEWHERRIPDDTDWAAEQVTRKLTGEMSEFEIHGPSTGPGTQLVFQRPGQNLGRLTFQGSVGSISAQNSVLIQVSSGKLHQSFDDRYGGDTPDPEDTVINWEGPLGAGASDWVMEFDIDLTLAVSDFVVGTGDNRPSADTPGIVYPDTIFMEISPDHDSDPLFADLMCKLTYMRVYGDAGPVRLGDHRMSPSELVMDLFGRMGIRLFDVTPTGYNILPYEIPGGQPYADGLDYAALLTGWRWLIKDTGHKAYAEFGPWDTRTWEVASPWARLDVVGANRYNRVRIPFTYKDGQTQGSKLVRADPDPLDHRSYFGLLGLDHPAMNDERAEALGIQVLKELSERRNSAQFSIGEVIGPSGPTSGHHVFAGDTLDGSPRGAPGGLRIVSLRRGYSFVEGQCGVDASVGSQVTGIPTLDRMLARRAKRLAA